MGKASRMSSFEDTQKILITYADELEEMKVYIHRDLATLPKEYVEIVNAYLTEAAKNIKLREQVEEFELKYEKARGALFDCMHERDLLEKAYGKLSDIIGIMESRVGNHGDTLSR